MVYGWRGIKSESVSSNEGEEVPSHSVVSISTSNAAFGHNLDAVILACEGLFNEKLPLLEEIALLDERTKKFCHWRYG